MRQEQQQEQQELVERLNQANKAYYTEANPIMTDREYDELYDRLVTLEKETGIIFSKSPTQQVGFDVLKSLKKVSHPVPLLSLDKTKEVHKLVSFLTNKTGILSYKLDGLTVLLNYEAGELNQAVTRGNGQIGEDVTHNALHFANVPQRIPYTGSLYIRGEAAITYTDFEAINNRLLADEQYKNPRNLCSGTVRQLDSSILKERKVMYYAFSLMKNLDFSLKSEALLFLEAQGFTTVDYAMVDADSVDDQVEQFKTALGSLNVPTDGLVLTYDDMAYSEALGATSKFPRDSIAFKWEDQLAETKLLMIEWNTSRTGLINPIAVFESVDLEGTAVKKASLHNLSILEELKLGIGDTITVYKANMIIPQVAENLTQTGPVSPPDTCPVCVAQTQVLNQNGVKTLYCTNSNCKAQRIKLFTHYVSRNAMNIEGLSEATITKFLDHQLIADISDIYKLKEHKDCIKKLEGFGEKSTENLLKSIEKSKTCHLYQFIYALGIFNVGLAGAKLLCEHFDHDITKIKMATPELLIQIEGFGDIIAGSIADYFSHEKNRQQLDEIYHQLVIIQPAQKETKLAGLTFVVTGSLSYFENRKALQIIIEQNSGKLSGSVTKNTNYLVNNDKESGSSKNQTAAKLGVPIISEMEFKKLFLD